MSFYKYESLSNLNDCTEEWNIRVRAQSIWKGVNRETGEFRGYNVLFVDDSSNRIHAFISPEIAVKFEEELIEGAIYTVKNLKVKFYNGDETNRAIRSEKHLYFSDETILKKDETPGLSIPTYSFDLFMLDDLPAMKTDNRFLTDVVAVIQQEPVKTTYIKDSQEKSHVSFSITDGKKIINVTFFNEFGDSLIKALATKLEKPVIITICCVKVSEWKGGLYLTNFPSTRFYLNADHYSVVMLRKRATDPTFYEMDILEEKDAPIPVMKVNELKNLSEEYIQKNVVCQLKVKKVDEKMNWYIPVCTHCDIEIPDEDGRFKCANEKCNRVYPYPDRRFQLYTVCGDDTGNIPIVWPNDEICRITGKTVYDLEVEDDDGNKPSKFPQLLKFCEKKFYNFTLLVTKTNVKEGSNVYKASAIEEVEFTATHSPPPKPTMTTAATEMTIGTAVNESMMDITTPSTKSKVETCPTQSTTPIPTFHLGESEITVETSTIPTDVKNKSPETAKSSNKSRPRTNVGMENTEGKIKQPRLKNVKLEKI